MPRKLKTIFNTKNNYKFYVLKKGEEYKVVCIMPGEDPLNGLEGWTQKAGPFDSLEEVEEYE